MQCDYIACEWVAAAQARHNVNPSGLADVIGAYAEADEGQTGAAIGAAAAAFPAWSMSDIQACADALEKVAAELLLRPAELGDLLAREECKTLPEATAEVARRLPARPPEPLQNRSGGDAVVGWRLALM